MLRTRPRTAFWRCQLPAGTLLLLAACATGPPDRAPQSSAPTSATMSAGAGSAGAAGAAASATGTASGAPPTTAQQACRSGPGRTVQHLPTVTIPAVHQPATVVKDQVVAGQRVPGFTVAPVDIPEQVVDAGCIVYHDAPAGCLGAVEISDLTIPPLSLPGYRVPGYRLGDGTEVPDVVVNARSVAATVVKGVAVPQVCQQKPTPGSTIIGSILRPSLLRPSALRASLLRPSALRPSHYRDGQTVPMATIPMLSVPMATVPMAYVPFATIEARYLTGTGGTEVLTGAGTLSYSTQADVLFDFGRTDIRPSAVPALRRIAADIARRSSGHAVTVDGHTDSVGTDAENLALSERRAEAVKTWLSTAGGIDAARIRAHGYGESVPVAPNTTETGADNPTGRTRNRRVVISSPG